MIAPYPLISLLEQEISNYSLHPLHPHASQIVTGFIKYLREPRFQSPLTLPQLSQLFHQWSRDLALVVVSTFCQSNTLKKSLIALLEYLNSHPKVFDYLLAIANYSASSIKLLRRNDQDALWQLRVFNYYKFYTVWAQMEQAERLLFTLPLDGDGDTLYSKVMRFDEKQVIRLEFFEEKLALLRQEELPWTAFVHAEPAVAPKLERLFSELLKEDIVDLQQPFTQIVKEITPRRKLSQVGKVNKALVELLRRYGFSLLEINNDIVLPVLIYLMVAKLDISELTLSLEFIKNFQFQLDPFRLEIYLVPGVSLTTLSQYQPQERITKAQLYKHRMQNLYEMLHMHPEADNDTVTDTTVREFKFFPSTSGMITYIGNNFFNHGEMAYYLTNLEAAVMFLSNVTIDELGGDATDASHLLCNSIDKLVEEDMMLHFSFPKGTLLEEEPRLQSSSRSPNRLRSSLLIQNLTTKFGVLAENGRPRSNLGQLVVAVDLPIKERFPSLDGGDLSLVLTGAGPQDDLSFSMMRSFLGRFNSVSQFSLAPPDPAVPALVSVHSRTRSLSYEPVYTKRNSITTKLATGVLDLMTKFNAPGAPTRETEDMDGSLLTIRPSQTRTRTNLSFHVMEKWMQTLTPVGKRLTAELTQYANVEFEAMLIADLKMMKKFYDIMCGEILEVDRAKSEHVERSDLVVEEPEPEGEGENGLGSLTALLLQTPL